MPTFSLFSLYTKEPCVKVLSCVIFKLKTTWEAFVSLCILALWLTLVLFYSLLCYTYSAYSSFMSPASWLSTPCFMEDRFSAPDKHKCDTCLHLLWKCTFQIHGFPSVLFNRSACEKRNTAVLLAVHSVCTSERSLCIIDDAETLFGNQWQHWRRFCRRSKHTSVFQSTSNTLKFFCFFPHTYGNIPRLFQWQTQNKSHIICLKS